MKTPPRPAGREGGLQHNAGCPAAPAGIAGARPPAGIAGCPARQRPPEPPCDGDVEGRARRRAYRFIDSMISLHCGQTGEPGFGVLVTGNVSPHRATTKVPSTALSAIFSLRT